MPLWPNAGALGSAQRLAETRGNKPRPHAACSGIDLARIATAGPPRGGPVHCRMKPPRQVARGMVQGGPAQAA